MFEVVAGIDYQLQCYLPVIIKHEGIKIVVDGGYYLGHDVFL